MIISEYFLNTEQKKLKIIIYVPKLDKRWSYNINIERNEMSPYKGRKEP